MCIYDLTRRVTFLSTRATRNAILFDRVARCNPFTSIHNDMEQSRKSESVV